MNLPPEHAASHRLVRALERRLTDRYQQFLFWRAMRRFRARVARGDALDEPRLLDDLVRGWGNRWSAQQEFLAASLREAQRAAAASVSCP